MARASYDTLLSLDRYAQVMGIAPSHFNQAAGNEFMPARNTCNDIWFQYDWQSSDRVSREQIASAIATAEEDLAKLIGFWPAPKWQSQEVQQYPRHHRPDVITYGMKDARGYYRAVNTDYGKVIAPGRRATTFIGSPRVAYSDDDGDGYDETATVTQATTVTSLCDLKVYFTGYAGDPEWEIRPPRTKTLAGGTLTATFWVWQLIEPALWEALVIGGDIPGVVDLEDSGNFVADVDVYHEYNDTGAVSSQLVWESSVNSNLLGVHCCGSADCPACGMTFQNGCLHIRDPHAGIVVPEAADYVNGAWASSSLAACRDPDMIKLWYYSGMIDEKWLSGRSCDPLNNWWAQVIAWLATARLERPLCSCSNVAALYEDLRTDVTFTGENSSYSITEDIINNPLGTRKGEVWAWKRVKQYVARRMRGYAV